MFDSLISFVNSLELWMQSPVLFFGSLVILKIFQLVVLSRLKSLAKKTTNDIDDVIIDIVSSIKPGLYVIVSVYLGLQPLILPMWADTTINILLILGIAQFLISSILRALDYMVTRYVERQETEVGEAQAEHTESMVRIFRAILWAVLWIMVALFILSNQGINITSLIASLGVGGIAVALALQSVLSDLFASFSIFLDTPFKVGDYIQFGAQDGVVEKIGVRSTRIRTLQGEQLIVPNQQLINAEIQNFRRMKRRREVMTLGVVYELSADTLKAIPSMIQEIVEGAAHAEFDRSHFSGYGDSAILFETVYFIDVPDYVTYMDVKQEINLKIFEAFEQKGIGFAYPTQTLYVQK